MNNFCLHHFYRSSLNDCLAALKLKENYPKALNRAAECLFHLNQFDECVKYCDKIIASNADDKAIVGLRTKALSAKVSQDSNFKCQV